MNIFDQFPTGHSEAGPHPQNPSDHWMVEKARVFAVAAHEAVKQRRKFTDELYPIHTLEVAAEVANSAPDADVLDIVTAILHDIIEDTGITRELIKAEFGEVVANLVVQLTDVALPEHGNRALRMAINAVHVKYITVRAKRIKLRDINHNVRNIAAADPDFGKVYLPEKKNQMIVGEMREADPVFYDALMEFIDEQIIKLNSKWKPVDPTVLETAEQIVQQIMANEK